MRLWLLLLLKYEGGTLSRRESGLYDNATGKTAEIIPGHLSDLKNNRDEALAPYEEFTLSGKTYYFTPGGFLYRKDPGSEEVGGFLCGYLTDEAWHYRTDDS